MRAARSTNCRFHRRSQNRAGAAILEFALILPLMVTIVLGCVDFGRFVYAYIAVHNAAREGAGAVIDKDLGGSATPNLIANVDLAVRLEMSNYDPENVASVVELVKEGSFRRVRVGVAYSFDTLIPWPGIPSHLDLGHSVEMRLLN